MTIQFKPAVRTNTAFIGAFSGASGSGKTKSALELAVGLAGPNGRIAGIDSEGRRMLHYADDYKFDHGEWRPPYSPQSLLESLKACEAAGYAVTIVDSASDEMEGEGGLIDMAAKEQERIPGVGAWALPKAAHKQIIKWLRQTKMHVIFCLRAQEKVRLEKDDKGRQVVVQAGWQPICEKNFMFDMTASFLFTPDDAGRGKPTPIKPNEKFNAFFPRDQFVTRKAGEALAAWCAGGAAIDREFMVLRDEGEEAAKLGSDHLAGWWKQLGGARQRKLGTEVLAALKEIAASAPRSAIWADDSYQIAPKSGADGEADWSQWAFEIEFLAKQATPIELRKLETDNSIHIMAAPDDIVARLNAVFHAV